MSWYCKKHQIVSQDQEHYKKNYKTVTLRCGCVLQGEYITKYKVIRKLVYVLADGRIVEKDPIKQPRWLIKGRLVKSNKKN